MRVVTITETDDGQEDWPRTYVVHTIIMKELYDDEKVRKFIVDAICARSLEDNGLRLADGETWDAKWYEVTEIEAALDADIYRMSSTVMAGDWRLRAIAKVVKNAGPESQ